MKKYILSVTYILLFGVTSLFAQDGNKRSQYIKLDKFLKSDSHQFNDIGYIQMVPQYEEVPDPNKAVTVEVFFGEFDGSPQSIQRLKHIKELLEDDKRIDPRFNAEVITISKNKGAIQNSQDFKTFVKTVGLHEQNFHHQQVPNFLNQTTKLHVNDKNDRHPANYVDGRKFWSLVRLSSSMAGAFAGLYFMEGISAPLAAAVTIWPGLASGAVTYYSNAFGAFLVNGKWSTWLLESDNYFAKKTRSAFSLNPINFKRALARNKTHFQNKYPTLYNQNPSLFNEELNQSVRSDLKKDKEKFTKILSRLHKAEEYFKWWVTEVIFTATAIQLPMSLAGISEVTSVLSMTGDILLGSTMGTIAQGPGDIAIQVRKYQMIQELKQDLIKGKIQVDDPKILLEEIKKVLATNGQFKNYSIHDGSHKALVKIENWARSRATLLSFFAVTGVALEIAGVPLARPLLVGVGVGGAIYYGAVQGWISPKRLTQASREYIKMFKTGEIQFSMQFLRSRYCGAKFMLKP